MKFTPEDFDYFGPDKSFDLIDIDSVVKMANARLKQWLATAPTVYLDMGDRESVLYGTEFDEATHQAKLVCIEEIKP